MIEDLIIRNRSFRRFYQGITIELNILKKLINLARLSPSAANLQPLKYIISNDIEKNALIFPHLSWAGYLKDWQGPADDERPSAYIVILCDTRIKKSVNCDHGIAVQSILLGATEKGLGGCIIASIDRKGLKKALGIVDSFEILLVLALGKPKEEVVIEEIKEGEDIEYWRDSNEVHHVPKRRLDDIIVG